ncbi:MAG: (2Fe-2S)-binding protein [Caldilineaceae bacterium]|nr:(2Fe-2S)-binding protein [Caldilineaceae bacterium]
MELTINGMDHTVEAGADRLLLWVLRDELGYTGTRFGCGAGICGSCTVHVDGVATRSCITPLAAVEGKQIRTIEGLAAEGGLHPVQQAFIDQQVPQCGWCMSGQIMTAAAFLEANPAATDEEIVNAMGNNYCRCGCYVRIKAAVQQAATAMADGAMAGGAMTGRSMTGRSMTDGEGGLV